MIHTYPSLQLTAGWLSVRVCWQYHFSSGGDKQHWPHLKKKDNTWLILKEKEACLRGAFCSACFPIFPQMCQSPWMLLMWMCSWMTSVELDFCATVEQVPACVQLSFSYTHAQKQAPVSRFQHTILLSLPCERLSPFHCFNKNNRHRWYCHIPHAHGHQQECKYLWRHCSRKTLQLCNLAAPNHCPLKLAMDAGSSCLCLLCHPSAQDCQFHSHASVMRMGLRSGMPELKGHANMWEHGCVYAPEYNGSATSLAHK